MSVFDMAESYNRIYQEMEEKMRYIEKTKRQQEREYMDKQYREWQNRVTSQDWTEWVTDMVREERIKDQQKENIQEIKDIISEIDSVLS